MDVFCIEDSCIPLVRSKHEVESLFILPVFGFQAIQSKEMVEAHDNVSGRSAWSVHSCFIGVSSQLLVTRVLHHINYLCLDPDFVCFLKFEINFT